MRQFDTSIKKLMEEKNKYNQNHDDEAVFLSTWDVTVNTKPYGILFNDNNLIFDKVNFNNYYYWTDEYKYSLFFEDYYVTQFKQNIDSNTFLIGNNGTSSIMLSMISLMELSINRILVFTPVYFSSLNLLEMLKVQIFRYDLNIENNFQLDIDYLEKYIKNNRIEALFITDPVFGTGVEYNLDTYMLLSKLIKQYNLYVIVDYVYGGMVWNDSNFIFNDKSYYIINNLPNTIFIESISKRMFINGIKFSLIFSSPTIIRKIKRLSIYTTGSMCLNQFEIFKKTYRMQNAQNINRIILENSLKAQNTYKKICAFLIGKNCIISNSNSSFFFVLGIPKTKEMNDINIAIHLLNTTGILTIPHSRYLLESENYYYFRVNLLIDENILLDSLAKILL